ncbi:hypothetical protein [Streptomyces sp. DH41]|nr:hypothetical protein [Streptomyces sp. DH41]MDG9722850.1 hypothetical protein [Streptomyces sp. DH41]
MTDGAPLWDRSPAKAFLVLVVEAESGVTPAATPRPALSWMRAR